MANLYKDLYCNQAGTGIAGFHGLMRHHQGGAGFFGRLLSKAIYPLLRFLGGQAITTGASIANDVFMNKKDWKESAKERLVEAKDDIIDAGKERAKKYILEGKGRKRKKSIKRNVKKQKFETFLNNVI